MQCVPFAVSWVDTSSSSRILWWRHIITKYVKVKKKDVFQRKQSFSTRPPPSKYLWILELYNITTVSIRSLLFNSCMRMPCILSLMLDKASIVLARTYNRHLCCMLISALFYSVLYVMSYVQIQWNPILSSDKKNLTGKAKCILEVT